MGVVDHHSFNKHHPSAAKMLTLFCISVCVAVAAGNVPPSTPSYPPPPALGYPHPPIRHYARPPFGAKGPAFDPLTFLLFQNGGLGGSGDSDLQNLLSLSLLGGFGGKGGLNPLLLASVLGDKCDEKPGITCTTPNVSGGPLCGIDPNNNGAILPCCVCSNKKKNPLFPALAFL